MNNNKRYYLTTPIYYVNGLPHIGTATTTLLADATTRYHRLRGNNPYFLTGTDEHAQKVADAAAKVGKTPQAFVDEVSQRFVDTWKFLNIRYDNFIRTSEPRHKRVVQEIFRRLSASGDVYEGVYEGWYSVNDETFFRDSEVDENGIVKETGAKVERIREDIHYFRLSAYGDRLREHILAHPDFLQPDTRRNEVLAFIDQGLRDIAVTRRSAGWGIEVPGDSSRVIYVWFDALINYLSETGWPDDPNWETLWPADVHLMGKEIYTRFHATLWPAMLMALGLPVPKHVVGHGWWLIEGEKGSKSKGNIPLPQEVVSAVVAHSGAAEPIAIDALRYYLLRGIQYSDDSEYSTTSLFQRFNSDLANDLGNVLNRSLRAKYFAGRIPTPRAYDENLKALAAEVVATYERALERFDWGAALGAAFQMVGAANNYLQEKAPWTLAKAGDQAGVDDIVYNALEAVRIAAVLVSPAMPSVAAEIGRQLGVGEIAPDGAWESVTLWGGLVPGTETGDASPIFPRIDIKAATAAKKEKTPVNETKETAPDAAAATPVAAAAAPAPATDLVSIDDFARIQLRVAEIVSAERIEKAKKLLRLQIRLGEGEERQLVAGIAESYAPEDLPGRQIIVIANLQPAVIRGVASQGMLLAATDEEGHAILLQPDKPVAPGSKIR